jgi:predicted outer membrane protein
MRRAHGRVVLTACGSALLVAVATAGCSPDYPDAASARPAESIFGVDAQGGDPGAGASPQLAEKDTSTWDTRWGPLTAADRDLLSKVRLATLWEMVMAEEAMQRGSSAKIREISAVIVAQHHTLDVEDRSLAAKLKVPLPIKPSDKQQEWMDDISGRTGKDYDATYVKWLRFAHGQVFQLIGVVRGTTQNTLIRRFAEHCNAAVLNHQRLLESTGLAGRDAFPSPPAA